MLPDFIINLLPPALGKFLNAGGLYLIVAIVVLLALWILYRKLFGGKPDPESALLENLGAYPEPETDWGPKELTVEGLPVRLRLVVVAPIGKQSGLSQLEVEAQLEQLVRGMSDILRYDQPKVRVWPPQLSHQGFAVLFHRMMRKPEREKEQSHWVLVAGRTPVGRRKLLVGLALWAEEPTSIGRLTLEPDQWTNVLRVQRAED